MSRTIIDLRDVWKIYKMGDVEVPALRGVSLKIKEGEFIAIVGSSGSGKSTMMNLVGCLDKPTRGSIILKDKEINGLRESSLSELRGKTIGFIFQQYNLIPNMTAYDNVLLSLDLQEMNGKKSHERVIKVLTQVGLADKMLHRPSQLSGGQQQRVSIARSLAANPEVILADEPTGALDSKTGKDVMEMLKKLWKEGKTIILVTHDLKLARYAKKQIELKDGKIVKIVER